MASTEAVIDLLEYVEDQAASQPTMSVTSEGKLEAYEDVARRIREILTTHSIQLQESVKMIDKRTAGR